MTLHQNEQLSPTQLPQQCRIYMNTDRNLIRKHLLFSNAVPQKVEDYTIHKKTWKNSKQNSPHSHEDSQQMTNSKGSTEITVFQNSRFVSWQNN